MKKIILFAAVLFAGVSIVKADTPATGTGSATATTTLNVKLNPIQTLFVNPAHSIVDLEYKTVSDYSQGVTAKKDDHLTVYSTGAFAVKVTSNVDDIKRKNGDQTIAASSIKVTASDGIKNPLKANYGTISLSTGSKDNLISSTTGGVNKTFNITYAGLGNDGYVNNYFNDETTTVYEVTVTYSIVAQ